MIIKINLCYHKYIQLKHGKTISILYRTLPPEYPGRQMHFPVRASHPLEKGPHVQLREQADPYFPWGHWQNNVVLTLNAMGNATEYDILVVTW